MNIAVYLGSNMGKDPTIKQMTEEVGKWLAENNHTLVYGGAKNGLMGVVADSVLSNGGHAIGVIPQFLELKEQAHADLDELHIVDTMAQRKTMMIELADAFITMPGGPGTLEEVSEIISKMNPKELYYNISGRGFALPRMWAQYGENNHGVCFIINKEKFSKLVDEYTTLHEAKPVEYKNFYDCYLMTDRKINKLIKKISNVSNGEFAYIEMLKAHDDFINYNFFEKNQNWQNENEYRVLAFVADKASNERLAIPEILTCLEGIVLGEKTDGTNEKIIKLFVNSLGLEIDVKRISFNNRLYMLI